MKFMLDKSTAALAKEKEEGGGTGEVYLPTAAQLEEIEAEGFETTKFVSHRTAGKVIASSVTGCAYIVRTIV